jgi:hypothetical protein
MQDQDHVCGSMQSKGRGMRHRRKPLVDRTPAASAVAYGRLISGRLGRAISGRVRHLSCPPA